MYAKIHVTQTKCNIGNDRWIKTFDTDCGKIGIMICYDVEELSRLLAEGMNILFVPFLTDTQNAYTRVKHCALKSHRKRMLCWLCRLCGNLLR
jgi:predicted amidohydrolase